MSFRPERTAVTKVSVALGETRTVWHTRSHAGLDRRDQALGTACCWRARARLAYDDGQLLAIQAPPAVLPWTHCSVVL